MTLTRSMIPVLVVLACQMVGAQSYPPGFVDPRPVLDAAAKAIGVDALKCVTMTGTGYSGALGQQWWSDRNVDWPRGEPLANYTRTMNWEAKSMKEEFDRKPGMNPASWKHGACWMGGTPPQRQSRQAFMVNGQVGWHVDGPGSAPVAASPQDAERWQLDLWLNPHGFLRAARMPGANPVAVWRWELGEMGRDGPTTVPEKVTVVSIQMGKYRIDATINKENMLQRIHTWVPDPVLGDMNYEHEFTNASYVDLGNGMKFPSGWHHHEGWDDNFTAQNITAGHNAFGGTFKDIKANACTDPVAVPDAVRQATFPVRVDAQPLAEGVFLLGGSTHNSVVVEFKDFVAVVEAPVDEARSLAVIEDVAKRMPGKPIRFLVNTHQHFDHIGGLRTYLHIGATIVTHWKNFDFYNRDVLNAVPRTLAPDMVSRWPPTELFEGYNVEAIRENYVITDGTRIMQMYYVHPLQHAEGMLMAYLPKEKLVIEADLFDTHIPPPSAPTRANTSLYNQVRTLKLDVARIVPIHGSPVPWADFAKLMTAPSSAADR
jgi:glyoxylase-like metal-dependent hydrolase (beta-lactamase superfamily II)